MQPWFGLHLPNYTVPGTPPGGLFDAVVEQARAAEGAGFSLVTVMDHLYQIQGVGPVTDPMLESWSTLAALARETSRVRLGTLVTGVTYRNPALLAKTATTLDVISGGRAILGLGAAWNDDEHAGYGFDFPPVRERMDRLDEALTIIRAMFTEDRPSFDGRHYRITEVLNVPRPVQPGGPRILVGGGGKQRIAVGAALVDGPRDREKRFSGMAEGGVVGAGGAPQIVFVIVVQRIQWLELLRFAPRRRKIWTSVWPQFQNHLSRRRNSMSSQLS